LNIFSLCFRVDGYVVECYYI